MLKKNDNFSLNGFFDANWAVNMDERKSIVGYGFTLGIGVISLASKKETFGGSINNRSRIQSNM